MCRQKLADESDRRFRFQRRLHHQGMQKTGNGKWYLPKGSFRQAAFDACSCGGRLWCRKVKKSSISAETQRPAAAASILNAACLNEPQFFFPIKTY